MNHTIWPGERVTIVRNENDYLTVELRVTMSDTGAVCHRTIIEPGKQVEVGANSFNNSSNPYRHHVIKLFVGTNNDLSDTGKCLSPLHFIKYAEIIVRRDASGDHIAGVETGPLDIRRFRGVRWLLGRDFAGNEHPIA